jgi:acyl-CoA synthetase (NDP forming)
VPHASLEPRRELATPGAHAVVDAARGEGRTALCEHEAYAVLATFGLPCPAHVFVRSPAELSDAHLAELPGSPLVVKAVSPTLLHKSLADGVAIVPRAEVRATALAMWDRLASAGVTGLLIVEFVPHDRALGHELLIAAQHTREFGPIVTLAPGGAGAEFVASRLDAEHRLGVVHATSPAEEIRGAMGQSTIARLATAAPNAGGGGLAWSALQSAVERMQRVAAALAELGLRELEVNPFVVSNDRLIAVDALATLAYPTRPSPARPVDKLSCLLTPRSVAIAGVSEQMNPGHVILRNLLRDGFDRHRITVIKPHVERIDDCAAVPSLDALRESVDVLVLAVPAAQAAPMLLEAIAHARAESVVLIPGGFEEKSGSGGLATVIRAALDEARRTSSRGPLVLGGNCLGFRSRPGQCDTLFIPDYKLPAGHRPSDRLAVISQSGAFAISRADQWDPLIPKYIITTGNQIDLTVGDCLTYLADDRDVEVFALYVEGFKPLDGWRTLAAAAEITRSGRTVVLLRAGRTTMGAQASASHTASIAGDYLVTRAVFEQVGAIVADDLEGFEDAVTLAVTLKRKHLAGRRVAAISNAGFECVAMADGLGSLDLAAFAPETEAVITRVLHEQRIDAVVDVHNPLDLTPMAGAAAYDAILRAVLADRGVDLVVLGCVPLTPALETLPAGAAHAEDLSRDDALPARLGRIHAECEKPIVVVVDAGTRYDEFAWAIGRQGIPVFRTVDRAMRAIAASVASRGRSYSACPSSNSGTLRNISFRTGRMNEKR